MYGIFISMTVEMNSWKSFRALGDPTRLKILEYLSCCPQAVEDDASGSSAGEVCCAVTGLSTITSTISHHLHELRDAGLIEITRSGKRMICRIVPEAMAKLAEQLSALATNSCDCSQGVNL